MGRGEVGEWLASGGGEWRGQGHQGCIMNTLSSRIRYGFRPGNQLAFNPRAGNGRTARSGFVLAVYLDIQMKGLNVCRQADSPSSGPRLNNESYVFRWGDEKSICFHNPQKNIEYSAARDAHILFVCPRHPTSESNPPSASLFSLAATPLQRRNRSLLNRGPLGSRVAGHLLVARPV